MNEAVADLVGDAVSLGVQEHEVRHAAHTVPCEDLPVRSRKYAVAKRGRIRIDGTHAEDDPTEMAPLLRDALEVGVREQGIPGCAVVDNGRGVHQEAVSPQAFREPAGNGVRVDPGLDGSHASENRHGVDGEAVYSPDLVTDRLQRLSPAHTQQALLRQVPHEEGLYGTSHASIRCLDLAEGRYDNAIPQTVALLDLSFQAGVGLLGTVDADLHQSTLASSRDGAGHRRNAHVHALGNLALIQVFDVVQEGNLAKGVALVGHRRLMAQWNNLPQIGCILPEAPALCNRVRSPGRP